MDVVDDGRRCGSYCAFCVQVTHFFSDKQRPTARLFPNKKKKRIATGQPVLARCIFCVRVDSDCV